MHLLASLALVAASGGLLFQTLCPSPYFHAQGGMRLLLVAVDIVIGPLLTFVVFDRRKPRAELRRDLAIVVALQVVALSFGLHSAAPCS